MIIYAVSNLLALVWSIRVILAASKLHSLECRAGFRKGIWESRDEAVTKHDISKLTNSITIIETQEFTALFPQSSLTFRVVCPRTIPWLA